jgi:hypothetical protein
MDLAHSIEPNSEQLNAEDLLAGPMTVTITGVKKGTADQPVFIQLAEFADRTYRPGKSMRRILVAAWGAEADAYVGRRITIYNDPKVKWAGQEVGGIRIAALSHITEPLTVALTVTRGKRAPFTVQPLADATDPVQDALDDIEKATSIPALKAAWDLAGTRGIQNHPDVVAAKERRKTELAKEES